MTERPFEDRSEVVKELYSELNTVKPQSGTYGKDLLESKIICTNMCGPLVSSLDHWRPL